MINVIEEIVRNQHIVLQCRVYGITSWMTLKSSEVKNFSSWRSNTEWKSFLVASASCHLALPYIRPKMRVLKDIPKIISQSPEFDRPVSFWVFSLLTTQYAWSNWAPCSSSIHVLSRICTVLEDKQAVGKSSWFFFSLGSACKRKYLRILFRGFLLVVVLLFVEQVCDQLVRSMRNSDSGVTSVLCSQIQF